MPNPLAGRYDQLAVGLLLGLAATLVCLAVWSRRRDRSGGGVPVAGLALAAAGAAGLALTGAPAEPALGWPALAALSVAAGAAMADLDRRRPGLVPGLLFLSAAGIYACVPDVEAALVVVGVAAPMTLLGWPGPPSRRRPGSSSPPARPPPFGMAGSLAAAGLLVWTVAVGGAGRPGSVVGGLTCLGLLVLEPAARRLGPRRRGPLEAADGRPAPPWVVLAAQAVLVGVASRVVGRAERAAVALLLAGLELVLALALIWYAGRSAGHHADGRTPP